MRLLLASALLCLMSCVTADEGKQMQDDIESIKKQLQKEHASREKEAKHLEELIQKATKFLSKNNADVGDQVDRIQTESNKNTGSIEELRQQMAALIKRFEEQKAKVDVIVEKMEKQPKQRPLPEDKDALFAEGKKLVKLGKHRDGRRFLRSFVERFTNDKRCAEAVLALGDSYYAEQKFAPAIQEYRKVIELYKRSSSVPTALFQIGMSFYQLKYCSDAKTFLGELVRRYRKHSRVKEARKVLKLIKKYKKAPRFCTS